MRPEPIYGYEAYYLLEDEGEIVACAGLWDRGRDLRERWRHRESGNERVVAVTAPSCPSAKPKSSSDWLEDW